MSSRVKDVLREGLAPLQRTASGFSHKARETYDAVRGIGGLVAKNRTMSAELVRLRNESRRLTALESENIALRRQMEFAQLSERTIIPCEVIARDISGWWQTIRLGKGRKEGIGPHMAVVTTDGLVGRTVSASPHTSDVILISDPACKVSSRITRTDLFGILAGQNRRVPGRVMCRMDFINKNTPVRAGDEVVTSGMGGVFPKGLLIGYVDEVDVDESGLYQRAEVVPKADLGALTYVFVVRRESPSDRQEKRGERP
jgi:rod shape-determining protein MreC